ncbi:MAG: peptidylprolyl isomerase, partial [Anaerolineales bacterium]
QTPLVLSRAILDSLIEQELARGEAEKLGIEVSDEELEARLQSFFNYFPDGTPTPFPSPTFVPTQTHTPGPSPTPDPDVEPTEIPTEAPTPLPRPTATEYTAAAYQEAYGEYIGITAADTRMSEDEIRAVFRNAILSERLRDAVITDIPTEEEIVHARHILLGLEDRDLAEEVLTRALDGEDFAALAAEYSIDTSNAESAGDLGSFGRGQMVPAFEEAAFSNDIGIVPELVETQFGFHIVEVLDKGTRPVSDYALNQQRGAAYREWLFELRSNADVEVFTWWEENPPDQPSLDSFIRRQQSTAVAAGTATAHAAPPATETPVPTETATAEE